MNIWLATIGEPVPLEAGRADRLHRTGYLAQFLANRGHRTLWWTSAFDHFRKKHLAQSDETVELGSDLRIRMLHGRGYRRNVSIDRLRDHGEIAEKFAVESEQRFAGGERPDVICAALPSIELAAACADFGRFHHIPVVLDMRDMWPDIFVDTAPKPVRPIARALLSPMFRQARHACARASAITGITDAFVDWGVARGRRARTEFDQSFPLGYSASAPEPAAVAAANEAWGRQGVLDDGVFTLCYFGGLSRQLDLMHAIDAARLLEARSLDSKGCAVRFVICGDGERLEEYRRAAAGLSNVILPGWVDRAAIYTLMRRSHAGLDPLPARYDFLATVNNKAIEYMSAGLPVVSSPRSGVLYDLLQQQSCGVSYDEGDAQGLADLIDRLARDRRRLGQMRQASDSLFRDRFMAEAVCASMESYFERIAGQIQ
jgi:glycosyltransferase involved in cell wall biosynthesis